MATRCTLYIFGFPVSFSALSHIFSHLLPLSLSSPLLLHSSSSPSASLLLLLLTCTSSIGVSRKRTEDVSRWIRSCSKPINKPHMGSSDVTVVPILGPLPRPGWEAITSLTMLYTSSRYTLRGREEGGEREEERGKEQRGGEVSSMCSVCSILSTAIVQHSTATVQQLQRSYSYSTAQLQHSTQCIHIT